MLKRGRNDSEVLEAIDWMEVKDWMNRREFQMGNKRESFEVEVKFRR
jgi:hypothetical protein